MCPKSFALGRWRGAYAAAGRRLLAVVPLAPHVDHESYAEGFALGREQLAAAQAARRTAPRR